MDLSDSVTQARIEKEMLSSLEKQHPDWQPAPWKDIAGERELAKQVKPDGVWKDNQGRIIIAECYARIGPLKPGHRRKLATDTLKLISLQREFGSAARLRLLLVVPTELSEQLKDNDWLALVIRKELEVVGVALDDEQRKRLTEAVRRQGEGQARARKEG